MKRKYGYKQDLKDNRDFKFSVNFNLSAAQLPQKTDFRLGGGLPPVYNQLSLGSCTANAIAAMISFLVKGIFFPSRLFIYYNERLAEGTVNEDAGAYIRTGIKSINVHGVCPEKTWPYIIKKFADVPIPLAYRKAKLHQSLQYRAVTQTETDIRTALAIGLPVVFGFMVQQSFESLEVAKTGLYGPGQKEKILGGHAVLIVGYDDTKKVFIVRNSWGESWGDKGYFYIPYSVVLNPNISNDFWVIQIME